MNHPNVLQNASVVKDLVEKVAKQLPFPIHVVLECNEPEAPEIIINEWIIITPFLDNKKCIGNYLKVIKYAISHIVNYPSYNRDEPDDVDVVDDITVNSIVQSIKEAFKLLIMNELDHAIDTVNQDEMSKEYEEYQNQQEKLEEHRNLFDPL